MLNAVHPKDQRQSTGAKAAHRTGVGNSFGSAGHIRDKLGVKSPVYLH